MIASLKGHLAAKSPQTVVIEVGGIGYEVFIPLSTFPKLPDLEKSVSFHTYTHVREDALQLYGFMDRAERDFFLLLISVSGIGPRLALNILSGLPVAELVRAVDSENLDRLKSIPGVGAKTAGRVILELRGKLPSEVPGGSGTSGGTHPVVTDALSALTNLGYPKTMASDAIEKVRKTSGPELSLEEVIREALKILVR
ncbi:MAG: Holliday junction branch migration protein RuvA [Nitrospirae bacterium]|nr:Holliday junction branch migration protein RuvA [Nitrospirota bacterium]